MDLKILPLYFFIGGSVVTAVTYFGGQGKGVLAAFIAMLPATTVITIVAIYANGGAPAAQDYGKGLLKVLPAWILYVVTLLVLLPRIGIAAALATGIAVYIGGSYLIIRLW